MIILAGCQKLDEFRTNPNNVSETHPQLLLTTISKDAFEVEAPGPEWASRMLLLSDGEQQQQWYTWTRGSFGDYSQLRNVQKMHEEAQRIENDAYVALSLFFRSLYFYNLTLTFGDIPYSDALKGESDQVYRPVYDTQKNAAADYLQNPLVDFDNANTAEEQTERIITQKYLQFYHQGQWTKYFEQLRTGYPEFLTIEGVTPPKRWMYPTKESQYNEKNLNEALKRQFKGYIHGIEVFNEKEWYPISIDWAVEKELAITGFSDIHGVTSHYYDLENGHRPMTLVFATEHSAEAIRKALFEKRSVAWFDNKMAGPAHLLKQLFHASLEITKTRRRYGEKRIYKIKNTADFPFQLQFDTGKKHKILPLSESYLAISGENNNLHVTNLFTGSEEALKITDLF